MNEVAFKICDQAQSLCCRRSSSPPSAIEQSGVQEGDRAFQHVHHRGHKLTFLDFLQAQRAAVIAAWNVSKPLLITVMENCLYGLGSMLVFQFCITYLVLWLQCARSDLSILLHDVVAVDVGRSAEHSQFLQWNPCQRRVQLG